jgi:hypothetical protein
MAFAKYLHAPDALMQLPLAIAMSSVLASLIAFLMISMRNWSPALGLTVIIVWLIAGILVREIPALRKARADRVLEPPREEAVPAGPPLATHPLAADGQHDLATGMVVDELAFEDQQLVPSQSPEGVVSEIEFRHHHLTNTVYERGTDRTNFGEAERVAEAVIAHAKSSPEHSLGVVGLSIHQVKAIREQIKTLRNGEVFCESFFEGHPGEPFYVENIKDVPEDERDVILVSVGYGWTADHTVSMNFGLVNKKGGEQLLERLFTLARQRCEIFTNLAAEDIDLTRTQSEGVAVLKRLLEKAQFGAEVRELEAAAPQRMQA